MLNAFKYTKKLEEAGFSREQAEIQLQVITEIVEGDLATKQDLKILETNMLNAVEIKATHIENKMQQLEYRLTIKLGTFLIIGFTTMATLMKFWLVR
jgi:hypothetical protein